MLQYALVAQLFSHLKLFSFVYFPFDLNLKRKILIPKFSYFDYIILFLIRL